MDATSYLLGKKNGGSEPTLQTKSVTYDTNNTYQVSADEGYDGLGQVNVTVNVPQSSDLDWSQIGYSETPPIISSEFNYSKTLYQNWNYNKKPADYPTMVYMPNVDFTNKFTSGSYFAYMYSLQYVPALNIKGTPSHMFDYCYALKSVDLSNLNTTGQDNFSCMFRNCKALQSVDLHYLNTSSATDFGGMFSGATSLINVNVSGLDTSKVTNMTSMFEGCTKLLELDLSSFEILPSCNLTGMFHSCTSLEKLDIRKMVLSELNSVPTNLFGANSFSKIKADCLIIVKDATEKQYINTNYSWLTNVQTVDEYENNS